MSDIELLTDAQIDELRGWVEDVWLPYHAHDIIRNLVATLDARTAQVAALQAANQQAEADVAALWPLAVLAIKDYSWAQQTEPSHTLVFPCRCEYCLAVEALPEPLRARLAQEADR